MILCYFPWLIIKTYPLNFLLKARMDSFSVATTILIWHALSCDKYDSIKLTDHKSDGEEPISKAVTSELKIKSVLSKIIVYCLLLVITFQVGDEVSDLPISCKPEAKLKPLKWLHPLGVQREFSVGNTDQGRRHNQRNWNKYILINTLAQMFVKKWVHIAINPVYNSNNFQCHSYSNKVKHKFLL